MKLQVYRIGYQYATPVVGKDDRVETGWINSSATVLTGGQDAQIAVDTIKAKVINKIDEKCSPDAPINTIVGFRLRSVELVVEIDEEGRS